jgi:hypothetical protein
MTLIIHLQQVFGARDNSSGSRMAADLELALSGAAATISSDALMNPFDGMDMFAIEEVRSDASVQSSSNECKSTDRPIGQYLNALAPSTAPKASPLFTSLTLPHYA